MSLVCKPVLAPSRFQASQPAAPAAKISATAPRIRVFILSPVSGETRAILSAAQRADRLFLQPPANGLQFALALRIRRGIAEIKPAKLIENNLRYDQPGVSLVIGRHNVPGACFGAGGADRLLIGVHIVLPVAALLDVGGVDFPV